MYRSFIRWALIVGSALVSVSIGLLIEGNFEQVLKYWNQLAPYVLTMFLGVSLVVASSFFSYLYRVSKRIDIVKTEIISKDENLIALKGDINKAWQELKAMKAAVAQAKAEQEQYRQEKAALQAELEKTRAELEKARQGEGQGLKWYGLIAVVEQCRKEGKTPQETAACLKGAGASWAMIGGLMHPQGNITDWQQYGKNLFNGSTKTLPW